MQTGTKKAALVLVASVVPLLVAWLMGLAVYEFGVPALATFWQLLLAGLAVAIGFVALLKLPDVTLGTRWAAALMYVPIGSFLWFAALMHTACRYGDCL